MTKLQYAKLLKEHDWYYYQSDSSSVYEKGKKNEEYLISLYVKYPKLKPLYLKSLKLHTNG